MPSPAVVIPFYNGGHYIEECVASILGNEVPEESIYLVDNSTSANELTALRSRYRRLRILRTKPRIGFGGASNLGALTALEQGAAEVMILNQDSVLGCGSVSELLTNLRSDPALGMVAPLNYTYDFQGLESIYIKYYLSECPALVSDAIGGRMKALYEVERVMGSCLAIKRECIKDLGLFDDLFFMYGEDSDLCRRYRLAGWRIGICPRARLAHAHGQMQSAHAEAIWCWVRISHRALDLTDISKPLSRCLAAAAYRALGEYVKLAATLRLGRLGAAWVADLGSACRFGRIWRTRRRLSTLAQRPKTSEVAREPNAPAGCVTALD